MLIYVLLGALAWQVITTAAFIISKENEVVGVCLGVGVPFWALVGISSVIKVVLKKWRYRNVRSILVNQKTGEWVYCRPSDVENLLEEDEYLFPHWTDELKEKYPQELWYDYFIKNTCSRDVGNFRYAPKVIWSEFPRLEVDNG